MFVSLNSPVEGGWITVAPPAAPLIFTLSLAGVRLSCSVYVPAPTLMMPPTPLAACSARAWPMVLHGKDFTVHALLVSVPDAAHKPLRSTAGG